jgi:hypothetical protein
MKKKTQGIIQYGLARKKDGIPLGFQTLSNAGGVFCVDTQTNLVEPEYGEKQWLVPELWQAEWVRTHSTPWYNAGYDTPTNNFDPEDLVVVKVTSIVKIEEADTSSLPSDEEIVRTSDSFKDKKDYERYRDGTRDGRTVEEWHHDWADYWRTFEYHRNKQKENKIKKV